MSRKSEQLTGEFRIILGQEGEFDLYDIERTKPVIVVADPAEYEDETLADDVADLEPGNKIEATLVDTGEQRETELFDSQLWKFADVEVITRTRVHHGFHAVPLVSKAESLVNRLVKEGKGIGRADIRDGDTFQGRLVAFNREHPSPAEPLFEDELESLRDRIDASLEVFQTATDDGRFFVHYYVRSDSDLARALRSTVKT